MNKHLHSVLNNTTSLNFYINSCCSNSAPDKTKRSNIKFYPIGLLTLKQYTTNGCELCPAFVI